jgi:very-short-patch-repair endonuclease
MKLHETGLPYQGSFEKDFLDRFSSKEIIQKHTPILYVHDGSIFKYIPDFYIPKHNLIVEIKSRWTYDLHIDKNIAKENACKKLGYNFIFIIDKNYDEL